jgi:hypothetical protein
MQTWNVHYNLGSWFSHSFAVGERCSNGNAYQCTIGGNSTAPPTGTGSDIAPGGAAHFKYLSGIDYSGTTGLQDWHDGRGGGNQGDHYTVNVWGNGSAITTYGNAGGFLSLYGWNANGFTTLIRAASGDSLGDAVRLSGAPTVWNPANGVAFDIPGPNGNPFYDGIDNVTFEGLQIRDTNGYSAIQICGTGQNLTVSKCFLDGYHLCYFPSSNNRIINSIGIDRHNYSNISDVTWPIKWDLSDYGASGKAVGCTFIGLGIPGSVMLCALGVPGQVQVTGCAFFGFTDPAYSQNAAGALQLDHCCTDVDTFDYPRDAWGSTNGAGNLFSKSAANQFVDQNSDFRLKAGTDMANAGYIDTAEIPAGDDFAGRARVGIWDIGALELSGSQNAAATISVAGHAAFAGTSTKGGPLAGASQEHGAGIVIPRPVQWLLATDIPNYNPIGNPPTMTVLGVGAAVGTARAKRVATFTRSGTGSVSADPTIKGKQFGAVTQGGVGGGLTPASLRLTFGSLSNPGAGGISADGTKVSNPAYLGSATINGAGGRTFMNTAPVSYTNYLRNPRFEGGATGTPGTDPTDMSLWDQSTNLSKQIVAFGTDTGIPYMDLRLSGTSWSGGVAYYIVQLDGAVMGGSTGVAPNSTWAVGMWLKQQAGSQNGLNQVQIGWYSYYQSNYVNVWDGSAVFFDTSALSGQFFSYSAQDTDGNVDQITPFVAFTTNPSQSIDITLRIGAPCFERAASASGKLILPAAGHIPAQGSGTTYWF